MDEKELKREWLKRKFASYDYHEEVLSLHDKFLQALKRHWSKPEIQKQYPDIYDGMVSPVFYNFDIITKPGVIQRSSWENGSKAMTVGSIAYNFSRGLGDMGYPFNPYAGMQQDEQNRLNEIAGKMLEMCRNIEYTVDKRWDDRLDILKEDYTGPVDYPANWKEEISAALGVSTEGHPRGADARCKANQPCPLTGLWWTPAKSGSRRYFQEGETMPDFPSSQYGQTIWYWDENQS